MQVAICSNEGVFRTDLKELLVKYKKYRHIQIDIYEFANGEELLSSDLKFDLIFLDCQMPFLNVPHTVQRLKQENALCRIVFVSGFSKFVILSLAASPYRFFQKPVSSKQIEALLDTLIRNEKARAPILIRDNRGQQTISAMEIVYLEGDGKYCTIRTCTETVRSSKTLSQVLEMLPQYCFYRVHKSYAVNLYHVYRVEQNKIVFPNGEKAIVAKQRMSNFQNTYQNFIKYFYLKV